MAAAAAAAEVAAAKARRAEAAAKLAAKPLLLRLFDATLAAKREPSQLMQRALEVCGQGALLLLPPKGGGGGGGGGGGDPPPALSPLAERIFSLLFSSADAMCSWALPFAQLLVPEVRSAFISRLALRGSLKKDMRLIAEALERCACRRENASCAMAMLQAFSLLLEHAPGAKAAATECSETRCLVFKAASGLEFCFPFGGSEEGRKVQRLLAALLRVFL